MSQEEPIGMYELLEALEAAIKSADPEKREDLAGTMACYQEDFPEEFHWAIGPQPPTLLHYLMLAIDRASDEQSKPRKVLRLIERKPEGNA
jgi:hypothetical protein